MARCSFCRKTIDRGTGKMLVKNDGKILFFCSSKCDKNMVKLGREPRYVRWTGAFVRNKKLAEKASEKAVSKEGSE